MDTPALTQAVRDRARGAMLGQLAGDALGSMVEFQSAAQIREQFPGGLSIIGPSPVFGTIAGQPTDDSEMALALADTLVARGARGYDAEAAAAAYLAWFHSGPFDCGRTIAAALSAMAEARAQGQDLAQAARAASSWQSRANGSVMRHAVLGIWGWAAADTAVAEAARADALLTHAHADCQEASAVYAVALARVIREGLTGLQAWEAAGVWQAAHGTSIAVAECLALARDEPPASFSGLVTNALHNAFYQAIHAEAPAAGIVATVMAGQDTDTNACIAGALLGAIYGASSIPAPWRQVLGSCRPGPDSPRPRPKLYWPASGEAVADALLLAGRAWAGHGPAPKSAAVQPARRAAPSRPSRSRFQGALLGGGIGDALGFPYESRPLDYHPRPLVFTGRRRGGISDDTQLTLAVGDTLLAQGWLDPEDLARRLVEWLPVAIGPGRATIDAVLRLGRGVPWHAAGSPSAGNGAAMRAAPIGLLRWNDPPLRLAEALASALPTHHDPLAAASTAIMAEAVASLVQIDAEAFEPGPWLEGLARLADLLAPEPVAERRDPTSRVTLGERVRSVGSHLQDPAPEVIGQLFYSGGFVLETLPTVLWSFVTAYRDPTAVLTKAITVGHDTDTVGAMAGTLAGALHGVEALPPHLVAQLDCRQELDTMACALFERAQGQRR